MINKVKKCFPSDLNARVYKWEFEMICKSVHGLDNIKIRVYHSKPFCKNIAYLDVIGDKKHIEAELKITKKNIKFMSDTITECSPVLKWIEHNQKNIIALAADRWGATDEYFNKS